MNFKPGDKVIFYRNAFPRTDSREADWLGKLITLTEPDIVFDNNDQSYGFSNSGFIVRESEIVPEHVYNSPLWKALT